MAIHTGPDLGKLHFPGTIHYINPKPIRQDEDSVLISEFGRAVRWAGIAFAIYVLLVAINLITTGVEALGYHAVSRIVGYATNPLLAVLIGLFLTFTVQSSTVITTITVATVGAGIVPVEMAAMVIMGANVGTCFTSQLVAFGFYRQADNLHRALAAAMTHWWFNVLSVGIFFPIELVFHPLTHLSGWLSTRLVDGAGAEVSIMSLIERFVSPIVSHIGVDGWLGHVGSRAAGASMSIGLGVCAIVLTIRWITHLMTEITAASSHLVIEHSITRRESAVSLRSTLAGLGLTMMSQSSSATICSVLPFAGTGNLATRKFFGIVLGANLGTTLTGVLTALAVPGAHGQLALQAALIHVLFNLIGILVVLVLGPASTFIVWLSERTATLAYRRPLPAFILVLASYTAIPLAFIALLG